MAKERKPEDVTEEEIAKANAEPLPDRHALSVIRTIEPLPQPILVDHPPAEAQTGIEPPSDQT
jgi:hypothetical protein